MENNNESFLNLYIHKQTELYNEFVRRYLEDEIKIHVLEGVIKTEKEKNLALEKSYNENTILNSQMQIALDNLTIDNNDNKDKNTNLISLLSEKDRRIGLIAEELNNIKIEYEKLKNEHNNNIKAHNGNKDNYELVLAAHNQVTAKLDEANKTIALLEKQVKKNNKSSDWQQ